MAEKAADYNRDEVRARHIWEGELVDNDEMFACPAKLVEKAMANRIMRNPPGIPVVGADIAHQGGDEITFYKRINDKVVDQYRSKKQKATVTRHNLRCVQSKIISCIHHRS